MLYNIPWRILPKEKNDMTYKELKQNLFDAVQILMKIYQDLAQRAEPLTLTVNSELKKIPTT